MQSFKPSELTLTQYNKVYHLNIGNNDMADTVILVGDQNRVKTVSQFFDSISYNTQHRKFATVTGKYTQHI